MFHRSLGMMSFSLGCIEKWCVCPCACKHLFPSAQYVGGVGKACFMPLHCCCIGTAETSRYTEAFTRFHMASCSAYELIWSHPTPTCAWDTREGG